MIYRSEVLLVLEKYLVEELKTMLEDTSILECNRKQLDIFLRNASEHLVDYKTGDELWYWGYCDWNMNRSDVKLILSLIKDASEEEYLFIRIGDIEDDIVVLGWHDNNFNVKVERYLTYSEATI